MPPKVRSNLQIKLTNNDQVVVRGGWVDGLLLGAATGEATSVQADHGTVLALGGEAPVEETLSNHIC